MVNLSLFLLCLSCVSLAFGSVDFFAGRSAAIIVQPNEPVPQDSVIILKGEQFSTTQLKTLQDTTFSDLFGHVMGTPPFHIEADRTGFPTTSLFKKPKAAVILVIDSVGAEILNQHPTLSLLHNAHTATLATQSFPPNSQTLLANLATGTTPSAHGIVGASWRNPLGEHIDAYDENGMPFSANLADVLLQEWTGRSLVVSASASPSFSSALAAHTELLISKQWNAHAYSFNADSVAFESRYTEPPCDQDFAIAASELAPALKDLTVTVGTQTVVFTALKTADLVLLAEVAFVESLIAKLKSNDLVHDDFPDLYSFVFSSLKEIEHEYGKDSTTYAAALLLVDKTASSLLAALDQLYAGRVASAIIALNPQAYLSSSSLKDRVYPKVARLLYDTDDFDEYFPALYVRANELVGFARDIMCANLQDAIYQDATVNCLAPRLPVRDFTIEENLMDDNTTADTDTVWAFWLNFWVTIFIAAFILWGVYCLAYVGIDAGKDSLLFRATGRHHPQN